MPLLIRLRLIFLLVPLSIAYARAAGIPYSTDMMVVSCDYLRRQSGTVERIPGRVH